MVSVVGLLFSINIYSTIIVTFHKKLAVLQFSQSIGYRILENQTFSDFLALIKGRIETIIVAAA